ncbi:MAG: rRNA maturation RNase YbeY [Alphaproteobacteria bacterium]|nr:rRNA maturation RNase YbeY [Alphaproteobacteria bacterium]
MTTLPNNIEIDITIKDEHWGEVINDINALIHNIIAKTLHNRLTGIESAEISIVLADDFFIQELNKTYREKDKPTNVLSFPMTEKDELKNPAIPFCSLGDIILAYDTISREALEQNKLLSDHFTHMLVHGCLHLLHYNHQTDEEAKIMEKHEIDVLTQLGIKNPYESD